MNKATFKSKLNSIMTDNMFDRQVSGKRSGTIDTKSLYKIGHSVKVFMKKEERLNKNYNISLLIDVSGSMSGSRIAAAVDMMQKLVPILTSFKGIKLEINVFNTNIHNLKTFEQEKYNMEQIIEKIERVRGGGTYDALAIASVAERIHRMKGRNMIIVLSDGEPESMKGYTGLIGRNNWSKSFEGKRWCDFDLKREVKKAINKGIVFIGVGVQTNAVQQYYPRRNTAVVQNLDTMFSELIRVFNRQLQRK